MLRRHRQTEHAKYGARHGAILAGTSPKYSQHKAPLIVISQVEPQRWLKLFENPVSGEAIVDRLIHPCQKITLKEDKSYREKLSEKKSGLKN